MIVNYIILTDHNESLLAKAVLEKLKTGWQLQGGVALTYFGPGRVAYAQALIFDFTVVDGPG